MINKKENDAEIKPYDKYKDIKKPFDYGSEEYISIVEKIKRKKEIYRRRQKMSKLMKLKYFEKTYD